MKTQLYFIAYETINNQGKVASRGNRFVIFNSEDHALLKELGAQDFVKLELTPKSKEDQVLITAFNQV